MNPNNNNKILATWAHPKEAPIQIKILKSRIFYT